MNRQYKATKTWYSGTEQENEMGPSQHVTKSPPPKEETPPYCLCPTVIITTGVDLRRGGAKRFSNVSMRKGAAAARGLLCQEANEGVCLPLIV